MTYSKIFISLCLGILLFACQSGEKAPSSSQAVTDEEAALAQKQLEELGIEISDQELLKKAEKGETEIVGLLLKAGVSPNAANMIGVNALMFATNVGHTETAKLLIEFGTNLDAQDSMKNTALMRAASFGKHDIAIALIEAGADLNLKGAQGRTALMNATTNRNLVLLETLIQAGAKLDVKDDEGKSALELAEKYGDHEGANILREADARK